MIDREVLAKAMAANDWSSWDFAPTTLSRYSEDGISKEEYLAYADAFLAALGTAGYCIVPKEATDEMCDAGWNVEPIDFSRDQHPYWLAIWQAMVAKAQEGQ